MQYTMMVFLLNGHRDVINYHSAYLDLVQVLEDRLFCEQRKPKERKG